MDDTQMTGTYKDDDLVYVDPDGKTVVGPVAWDKNWNPKPLLMPSRSEEEVAETGKKGKPVRKGFRRDVKRYYPWGTYRSMKIVYRLEGKQKRTDPGRTLDEVLPKALQEPYWD